MLGDSSFKCYSIFIKLIFICFGTFFISACQESLQEAAPDQTTTSSLIPDIPEADSGGGAMENEFIPLGVFIRSIKDGDAFRGGEKVKIQWTIRTDESYKELDPGFYLSTIQFSKDKGVTWDAPPIGGDKILGSSCETQEDCQNKGNINYLWTVPNDWNGDQFQVKITAINILGQPHESINHPQFIIDNIPPNFVEGSLSINNKTTDVMTRNPFIKIGFQAVDLLTPITHFCFKLDNAINPNANDNCWTPVTTKGIIPSKSLTLSGSDLTTSLGFIGGTFTAYLWLKDKAGNVSELSSSGAGTSGTDKQTVIYNPGASVNFTKLAAGNIPGFASPPLQSEIKFDDDHNSLYVRWGYQWINGGKVTTTEDPIQISYSTDGTNFIFVSAAHEGANGNCEFDESILESGCFEWKNIPAALYTPSAKTFYMRVSLKDEYDFIYSLVSHPLNSGSFRVLAGNTNQNIGGDAGSAIFNIAGTGLYESDRSVEISAVDEEGGIYVVDEVLGILKVNPSNGIVNVYLNRGAISVDGFLDNSTTTVSGGVKILLGYSSITLNGVTIKNQLFILENQRVRRVVLKLDPKDNKTKPYLETFIGANGVTSNGAIRGSQQDRCIIFDKKKLVVTSFTGYPEGTTTQPVYIDYDPRWTCKLSAADKLKGYTIFYTATDPEKIGISNGGGLSSFWTLLPNGNIYFSRLGFGNAVKNYDLRLYKYDVTKKAYKVFPIILSGKGTLRNCAEKPLVTNPSLLTPDRCEQLLFNPISEFSVSAAGITFNPVTSIVNFLNVRMQFRDDGINWKFYSSNLNPYSGISNSINGHYPYINNWLPRGLFTSRRGDLYSIHAYDSSLYKSNPSNFSWVRILGDGSWSNNKMCSDGTLATNCPVKLQSGYITSDNKIFFWDNNKLRAIDQDGKVATIIGQSKIEGENIDPLLARIGDPSYISTWGQENKITFYDKISRTIREVNQGANIQTIAGSGKWENKTYTWSGDETTLRATELNIFYNGNWERDFISVDKNDGTLYSSEFNNSNITMIKLNRTTGKWNRIFGRTAIAPIKKLFSSGAGSCDNQSVANCLATTLNGGAYTPSFDGQAPSRVVDGKTYPKQILIHSHIAESNIHKYCYMKSFSPDLNAIQHFMGNNDTCYGVDVGGGDNHYPSMAIGDKISIANSNKFPTLGNLMRMVYSVPLDGWFAAERYSVNSQIYFIKNYRELEDVSKNNQVTKADSIEIAQKVGNPINSFTVLYDSIQQPIYIYCSNQSRLYSVKNGIETELVLPAGVSCYGRAIETTFDNKKIIFPFQRNGLRGIGEYEIL